MMANTDGEIYSATYSNVPVYELKMSGDHIMRRRSDNWINATHILKLAGFDKPARTRILEREVQKGVHEKIQGGYGKYQGTWVPLADGRALAEKNGVLARLSKIFEFVPGDRSPPPAPKHQTAASSRPKAPKAAGPPRKPQVPQNTGYYRAAVEYPDQMDISYVDEDEQTPMEDLSQDSTSFLNDAEHDELLFTQLTNSSRKRKRMDDPHTIQMETAHTIYGDELLDYFIVSAESREAMLPPDPPQQFMVDRPIDNVGNTPLHWACAMGDMAVVKDLLNRGANPRAPNAESGATPLIRAVLYINNHEKQTFPKLVQILQSTVGERDWHGATVFHHIAEVGRTRAKWSCARYYTEILINKLRESGQAYAQSILTLQDKNQDTALLLAVRHNCLKVANILLNECPEAGEIPDFKGETANELLRQLKAKRQSLENPPSSPPPGSSHASAPGSALDPLLGSLYRSKRNRKSAKAQPVSRAASSIYSRIDPFLLTHSQKLASMYDSEIRDRDLQIAEAAASLQALEAQKHKIRQETFPLMAQAEQASDAEVARLRVTYEEKRRESESLLEQRDHRTLQAEVWRHDQSAPSNSFRSANPNLTGEDLQRALPIAQDLRNEQERRRSLIREVAVCMGEAGTGERVGKHRKLVSIATGIREEELDGMSVELLENLLANKGTAELVEDGVANGNGPRTPTPSQFAPIPLAA